MFLAHMPAGYLVSKFFISQFRFKQTNIKFLMCIGLLGSIFPDLDMFYFYLIDNRQHGHHSYWTHIPFYWKAILLNTHVLAALFRSRALANIASVFIAGTLTHLLLDTFAGGGIKWLHPFNNEYLHLFSIPSQHNYWIWNYVLHWTMLVEFCIISMAVITYWRARKKS